MNAFLFKVSILDVSQESGQETVEEFRQLYGKENASFIHCDVTNKGNVEGNISSFQEQVHIVTETHLRVLAINIGLWYENTHDDVMK